MTGSLTEFCGSIMYIKSLSEARAANINLGISPSITTLFTVFVTGISFALFRERVGKIQLIGIVVIILAVIVISLTGPDGKSEQDLTTEIAS